MGLARINEVDGTIRSATLPDPSTIDIRQQSFNGQGTDVQRNVDGDRTRPTIRGKPVRRRGHEYLGGVRGPNRSRDTIQITPRHSPMAVDRRQQIIEMLAQHTRPSYDT